MNVVTLDREGGHLELDACKACQIAWFDAHERDELAGAAGFGPQASAAPVQEKPLPMEAARVLATARAEQTRAKYEKEFAQQDPDVNGFEYAAAWFGLPVEHGVRPIYNAPLVTWSLGVLLVVAFLFASSDAALWRLGFIPSDPLRLGGATFVTTFFLHAGLFHLLGNLYFLIVFGDNVEDVLGHGRFVALVLGATVFGALLHLTFDPRPDIPLVGASGGVSGILVFYALQFPGARLGFRWWHWAVGGGVRWFLVPVLLVFVLWLALQVVGALSQLAGCSSVSAFAHLGGVAAGVGMWLYSRGLSNPSLR